MADTPKAAENRNTDKAQMTEENIVFFGDSAQVNPLGALDYGDYQKSKSVKQELLGFDKKYYDIVDYILKITHEIWEEKGIGIIYDTYHNNTIVHNASVTQSGIKPVIAGTLSTLHSFPDRRLVGENVIWSEDKPGYFLSSHRVMSWATNMGDSSFGPATGKKIFFRTVADCAVHKNRIYEEWLVRDNLWIVRQLGFDPGEVAKAMAGRVTNKMDAHGIGESMNGQFMPQRYKARDNSPGELILEMHNNIFGCKLINRVRDFFAPNAAVNYICGQVLRGADDIQSAIISLLASFPNACHSVDRVTYNSCGEDSWDVAVRWRIRGLHEGLGMFGGPTNKLAEILGIDHYRVEKGLIREGWVVFDALDVLRQISEADHEENGGM